MSGHGHVTPNPNGVKARCGGPGICVECSREAAQKAIVDGMQKPLPIEAELAVLHKFYGTETQTDLILAQARHIEKLQGRLKLVDREQPAVSFQRIG